MFFLILKKNILNFSDFAEFDFLAIRIFNWRNSKMKKTLIAMAVLGAASGFAMAASNVTLYGVIETGVVAQKAKHGDTTVQMKSGFDQGSRWGIKGVEDLGNGYSVGFILEQGFNGDDGSNAISGKQFSREAIINVKGGFGSLAFGRTGTLSSGAQSQNILTGWALGTGFGLSSWTSAIGTSFSRVDNVISYASPKFSGFTVHAMYSNGLAGDSNKWSENNHYYGLGLKYQEAAIKSSLIFEAVDGKGTGSDAKTWGDAITLEEYAFVNGLKPSDKATATAYKAWAKGEIGEAEAAKKTTYVINYGLEWNLGSWTPMFAYQWANQDGGKKTHMFGLSTKVAVGGGDALIGARYLFGKDEAVTEGTDKVRAWNIGAAYIYPLSKRTALKAYAGYADAGKAWKNEEDVAYNGWQAYLGMRHSF